MLERSTRPVPPGKALHEPSLVSRPIPVHAIPNGVAARESIPVPLRLSLSGPSAVHEATLAARDFAGAAALAEADASRLAIVAEELVTNLYDHGGLADHAIVTIELSATDAEVVVILTDPGRPFDPGLATLDGPIPSRGGGAGLKLVRAWATDMDYETANGENRLRLRLPRSQ